MREQGDPGRGTEFPISEKSDVNRLPVGDNGRTSDHSVGPEGVTNSYAIR